MQINVAKNEVMGLGHQCPPHVTLPSFPLPPNPLTNPPDSWSPDPSFDYRGGWHTRPPDPYAMHRHHTMGTVTRVSHIVHLGHPLTPSLSHHSIFTLVLDELEHTLSVLGTQPLPPLARAEVTRTVIHPTLLYRLACYLPAQAALGKLSQRLVDYVLQVHGLPLFVSTKTLFSHQSCGFGIPFLPVLQTTRVLDAVQKGEAYCDRLWAPTEPPYRPSALFRGVSIRLPPAGINPVYNYARRLQLTGYS